LGVVPNFSTVETPGVVASLSPKQKWHLASRSSVDPFVFVADGFVAGLSQAVLARNSSNSVLTSPDISSKNTRSRSKKCGGQSYFPVAAKLLTTLTRRDV
jgi:hypothetical protein